MKLIMSCRGSALVPRNFPFVNLTDLLAVKELLGILEKLAVFDYDPEIKCLTGSLE